MKKNDICDKCGKTGTITEVEYICLSEKDKVPATKKEKYSTIIRYLASVTSRLCDVCARKRRNNYLLAAILFLLSSLPFFILWVYLELGLILLIVSVSVIFLSSKEHEMEYMAKINYRKLIEGKEGQVINPKIIKKERWEEIKKNPAKFSSIITDDHNLT